MLESLDSLVNQSHQITKKVKMLITSLVSLAKKKQWEEIEKDAQAIDTKI